MWNAGGEVPVSRGLTVGDAIYIHLLITATPHVGKHYSGRFTDLTHVLWKLSAQISPLSMCRGKSACCGDICVHLPLGSYIGCLFLLCCWISKTLSSICCMKQLEGTPVRTCTYTLFYGTQNCHVAVLGFLGCNAQCYFTSQTSTVLTVGRFISLGQRNIGEVIYSRQSGKWKPKPQGTR